MNRGVAGYPAAASEWIDPFGFPYTIDPGILRADALTVGSANAAVYLRCHGGGLVTKLAIQVGAQSGNICLGVYANSGNGRSAVPGTLLATTGSFPCPAIGYAETAIGTVRVKPGDWFAISADNTTATFIGLLGISGLTPSSLGLGRQYYQTTAHPLPATPTSLSANLGKAICVIGVTP